MDKSERGDLLGNTSLPDIYTNKEKKYAVQIVFDKELEEKIKEAAKEQGIGVATYIKMLVVKDLKANKNGNR